MSKNRDNKLTYLAGLSSENMRFSLVEEYHQTIKSKSEKKKELEKKKKIGRKIKNLLRKLAAKNRSNTKM
tara:strand:- start:4662 stop:4871 length:210 start_codon:yes stop_codon:yes gene_type:complete